jgi:hypothetical protein
MTIRMNRLDSFNPLFTNLEQNPPSWWSNLISDKDIYVEIRKENYIDIYFNGGNIIRELRHDGKCFSGKINYKYLLPDNSEYINYDFTHQESLIKKSQINLFNFADFNALALRRIKANISQHYPAESEKGIQARFITKSRYFIDSEFAYLNDSEDDKEKLRIDLVWLDTDSKKIVFVELKCMGDNRLYNDEITYQLTKYVQFIKYFEVQLLSYYKTLFMIKKRLKILSPELDKLNTIDDFSIEKKPLLLFGDCEQVWIDKMKPDIKAKIGNLAYGTYYYGSTRSSCNLIQPKHKNRDIY